MFRSSKNGSWRRRFAGARRIGPTEANRKSSATYSVSPLRRLLILLIMAAAAALWAPAAAIAASRSVPITTAYCIDCAPFQFQDENGEAAGLIVDIWRLWSEKTGIEIDFKPGNWDETLLMVIEGETEAHAGLFYSDRRAPHFDYGRYLTTTETHYFIKKGLPPIENVRDLAAYKVGVLAFDFVEGFLEERLPKDTVVAYESYDTMMAELQEGRLQVFAADTPTGIYHLQKAGLGFSFEYPKDRPLYTTDWLTAVAKGNNDLIQIINQGMVLITKDERQEIENRWVAIH